MRYSPTLLNTGGWGVVLLAICTQLCGCRLPGRGHEIQDGLVNYDQASISYDVNRDCGTLLKSDMSSAADAGGVTQVAYHEENAGTSDVAGRQAKCSECIWKTARLSIQYPHPDAVPGMAQATLRLSAESQQQASSPNDFGETTFIAGSTTGTCPTARNLCNDELWVLDIPKLQMDQLLAELSSRGFFRDPARPQSGSRLEIGIDKDHTAKTWNRDPQLDHFVKRVYREGRLRGFIPCSQACKAPAATPRFSELSQRS